MLARRSALTSAWQEDKNSHIKGRPERRPLETVSAVRGKLVQCLAGVRGDARNGAEEVFDGKVWDDDLLLLDGGDARHGLPCRVYRLPRCKRGTGVKAACWRAQAFYAKIWGRPIRILLWGKVSPSRWSRQPVHGQIAAVNTGHAPGLGLCPTRDPGRGQHGDGTTRWQQTVGFPYRQLQTATKRVDIPPLL
jgi:hypothetical protein